MQGDDGYDYDYDYPINPYVLKPRQLNVQPATGAAAPAPPQQFVYQQQQYDSSHMIVSHASSLPTIEEASIEDSTGDYSLMHGSKEMLRQEASVDRSRKSNSDRQSDPPLAACLGCIWPSSLSSCRSSLSSLLLIVSFGLLLSWVANNILWLYSSMYFGQSYAFFFAQMTQLAMCISMVPFVLWKGQHGSGSRRSRRSRFQKLVRKICCCAGKQKSSRSQRRRVIDADGDSISSGSGLNDSVNISVSSEGVAESNDDIDDSFDGRSSIQGAEPSISGVSVSAEGRASATSVTAATSATEAPLSRRPSSAPPRSTSTLSWRVYAFMGLLDGLYNILTTMASPRVSGPFQNLLFQLPVPISMIVCAIAWRKRYSRGEMGGAMLIVAGACISILPSLIHPGDDASTEDDGDGEAQQDNPASAVIVYTIGVTFWALCSVYKEYALKRAPGVDYWYMSLLENWWTFLFGFLFMPLLWLPGVSVDTPTNTWPHFIDGARCLFTGVDVASHAASHATKTQCEPLSWIFVLFVLSQVAVAVLGLAVCRLGDSVVFTLINSLQLPITILCYTSSVIMTAALATKFSPAMWVGLAVVCIGFAIYQFIPLRTPPSLSSSPSHSKPGPSSSGSTASVPSSGMEPSISRSTSEYDPTRWAHHAHALTHSTATGTVMDGSMSTQDGHTDGVLNLGMHPPHSGAYVSMDTIDPPSSSTSGPTASSSNETAATAALPQSHVQIG